MDKTKNWWESRAVWAGAVAVVIGALKAFGLDHLAGEEEAIVGVVMNLAIVIASVLGIAGRVTATKQIKKPTPPSRLPILTCFLCLLAFLVVLPAGGCQEQQEQGVRLDAPFYVLVENQAINGEVQAKNCWDWYQAVPDGMKPQLKPYCDSLAGMSDSLFILLDEHDGIDPNAGDGGAR